MVKVKLEDGREIEIQPPIGKGYKHEQKRYTCVDCKFESDDSLEAFVHGLFNLRHRVKENW